MKKILLILCLWPAIAKADITPLQNLMLINDFEIWLDGGNSLFNWDEFRKKEIKEDPRVYLPVQIYIDYKRNVFNGEKLHGGQVVHISAPFNQITRSDDGRPVIVFNVADFNHLYVNGVSAKEVENLQIGNRLNLLCIGFQLDRFDDMSATCSMFKSPSRFIAANNVQHEDSQKYLIALVKKNEEAFNRLESLVGIKAPAINKECIKIDSINYDKCLNFLKKVSAELKGSKQ